MNLNKVKLQKTKILKKLNFRVFLFYLLMLNIFFFFSILTFRGTEKLVLWNHFVLLNFNYYIMFYCYCFNVVCLLIFYFYTKNQPLFSNEFVFAIGNISHTLLLLFLTNNLYSLFFILELISSLIFYKFTVSKFWLTKKNISDYLITTLKFTKTWPTYYVNMLFFQYWSAFFSSVLLLYAVINIESIYGSTDWISLNFLYQVSTQNNLLNVKDIFFIFCPFFFGVLIKLGLTPIHLYKIEVYKGLPFISIFFYTTYFFLAYFTFFFLLFVYYLAAYSSLIWFFFIILILIGCSYFLLILFNGNLLKTFFAFSTIINATNFMLILTAYL